MIFASFKKTNKSKTENVKWCNHKRIIHIIYFIQLQYSVSKCTNKKNGVLEIEIFGVFLHLNLKAFSQY